MMNPNPGRDKLRQALADFTTEYYKEDVSSEIVPIPELRLPIQNRRLTTRALSRLRLIGRQVASFLLVLLITTIMHAPMQKTVRNISMPEFLWKIENGAIVVFYDEHDRASATRLTPRVTPGYIPENFASVYHEYSGDQYVRIYQNERGDALRIVQGDFRSRMVIPCEGIEFTAFYRDGQQILLGHEGDRSVCVWSGQDSVFMMTVYGSLEEEEILRIVDQYERKQTDIILLGGQ